MTLRSVLAIAATTLIAASAAAQPQHGPAAGPGQRPLPHVVDAVDRPTLGAAVLERALVPYLDGIRQCYLGAIRSPKATGHLRLELVIEPAGTVGSAGIVATGASATERRRLEACVRTQVRTWHFPVRGGATQAVVPFYFQRTRAPGAGPRSSCWSPRGCPERQSEPRHLGPERTR